MRRVFGSARRVTGIDARASGFGRRFRVPGVGFQFPGHNQRDVLEGRDLGFGVQGYRTHNL